ncbi:hypothetical protein C8R44DRAFT_807692 [Mycena epipterygia]|nr:hypothetical protein C8R44DRAFT_807692 [Mycena epipterygia]
MTDHGLLLDLLLLIGTVVGWTVEARCLGPPALPRRLPSWPMIAFGFGFTFAVGGGRG